jgi:hypothetical protein
MESFHAKCEQYLEMSIDERIERGFFWEYKPVLDDEPYRSFEKMEDYRKWAHENVPREYGYRVVDPPADWKQFDDEDKDYYIIPI